MGGRPGRTTKPAVTVFDTNPKTGEPFMTVDHAYSLAYSHIHKTAANLTGRVEIEDLCQKLMLKLSGANYKPEKSAPTTFAINVFRTGCGNVARYFESCGRDMEIKDFLMTNKDGDKVLATEAFGDVDECTPESRLDAAEEWVAMGNEMPDMV